MNNLIHKHSENLKEKIKDIPPILIIEPTNACNAQCTICPRSQMKRPIGFLSWKLFLKIITEAAQKGSPDIRLFNFGEPTLHPKLPEMIRKTDALGLKASIQTNGLLITPEKAETLTNAGLDHIGISVNGLTQQEYEQIRPGLKLKDLFESLETLRHWINKTGKKLRININAQILKEEVTARDNDIRAFANQWSAIADTLTITGLSRYDKITLQKNGQPHKIEIKELAKKPDHTVSCNEPFDRLVIKWNGIATPCCADYDAQMPLGDLNKQTLSSIWNGPRLKNLRQQIIDKNYSRIPLCRSCPKFYSEPFNIVFKKG